MNCPTERNEPDWAAKIHIALAPVYYHNYVLGNLTAAQLRNHLEERVVGGSFYEHECPGAICRRPSSAPAPATTGAPPFCAPQAKN